MDYKTNKKAVKPKIRIKNEPYENLNHFCHRSQFYNLNVMIAKPAL